MIPTDRMPINILRFFKKRQCDNFCLHFQCMCEWWFPFWTSNNSHDWQFCCIVLVFGVCVSLENYLECLSSVAIKIEHPLVANLLQQRKKVCNFLATKSLCVVNWWKKEQPTNPIFGKHLAKLRMNYDFRHVKRF